MPIPLTGDQPSVCIRREAFDRSGLTRAAMDERFALTADDFRVEGDLIVVGPLYGEHVTTLVDELEEAGLVYYEDFFEWSGNWPEWVQVWLMGVKGEG